MLWPMAFAVQNCECSWPMCIFTKNILFKFQVNVAIRCRTARPVRENIHLGWLDASVNTIGNFLSIRSAMKVSHVTFRKLKNNVIKIPSDLIEILLDRSIDGKYKLHCTSNDCSLYSVIWRQLQGRFFPVTRLFH